MLKKVITYVGTHEVKMHFSVTTNGNDLYCVFGHRPITILYTNIITNIYENVRRTYIYYINTYQRNVCFCDRIYIEEVTSAFFSEAFVFMVKHNLRLKRIRRSSCFKDLYFLLIWCFKNME